MPGLQIKKRFNQYQANHNLSPDAGGTEGFLKLLRLVLVVALLMLIIWLFA